MKIIGDPHLGKEFIHNVPLDRRGERETMMMEEFQKQLNNGLMREDVVVIGDLFEKPVVSMSCLFNTIDIILYATARWNNKLIIIAGNHDIDKAAEKRGSFDLLSIALDLVPNVYVLYEPRIIDDTAYFPWQYDVTALEQVQLFDKLPWRAIGHWDLESYGGDESHLCPAGALADRGVASIVSGHWHVAGQYVVDSHPVTCTGSMQPMTHAEDPKGLLYVTLTKEEYEDADPKDFKDKYVRVRLEAGEEITPPPTCLGFKTETVQTTKEIERVNLGTFDMNEILTQAFESFEVKKPVQTFIKENLNGVA